MRVRRKEEDRGRKCETAREEDERSSREKEKKQS